MSGSSGTTGHLDIGGVFEATGDYYKRGFGTFWIVALVLLIPAAIIQGILGNDGILGLIGSLVQLIASAWLIGSVIRIVQDIHGDGQVDYSIGELLGSVWSRLLAIIVLQFLLGIIIGIGIFLFIIPGIILALVLAVAMPSLIVEGIGIFDSMSRSAELTKHNRMRILAVGLLVILIIIGVVVITALLSMASWILGAIAGIVLGVLLYPYLAMLTTVLYYRLVELKEGGVVAVEETVIVEEDAGPPPVA